MATGHGNRAGGGTVAIVAQIACNLGCKGIGLGHAGEDHGIRTATVRRYRNAGITASDTGHRDPFNRAGGSQLDRAAARHCRSVRRDGNRIIRRRDHKAAGDGLAERRIGSVFRAGDDDIIGADIGRVLNICAVLLIRNNKVINSAGQHILLGLTIILVALNGSVAIVKFMNWSLFCPDGIQGHRSTVFGS